MTDDFKLISATIFLALWTGLMAGSIIAQEAHVGARIVFKVDSHDSTGRPALEPQEVHIVYVISPERDYSIPFSDNDLVVCRPYNEGSKYFLQCGGHRYTVNTISLVPKEKGDQQ